MYKKMTNEIDNGSLGKVGTQIKWEVNQWDRETMKSKIKSRSKLKCKNSKMRKL